MFEKLMELLGVFKSARLLYEEDGRCGRIWYREGQTEFGLYWEFGGGDTLVIIDVPEVSDWEERTGLPLARRTQVLDAIAKQVIRDKTTWGWNRYEIGADSITIFA